MNIIITNNQQDLRISKKQVIAIVKEVIAFEGRSFDEASINFVTQQEICELHQNYFDDPSPTDCISFPVCDDDTVPGIRVLGDVFVCPHTATDYAAENQIDPYEEVTLYVVHGLLHLMGYDDLDEDKELLMRIAEKRQMDNLKSKNLFLS